MNARDIDAIAAWLVGQGLAGTPETALLQGFCQRCLQAGLPLSRAIVIIDTLHPIYEGRAFRWSSSDEEETVELEYGRTDQGEAAENWRRSVFYHLLSEGLDEWRCRFGKGEAYPFHQGDPSLYEDHTDYLAMVHRFEGDGVIGEMDCVYSTWLTRDPQGFDEAGLVALRRLLPPLCLAVKCVSLARISKTLVEVYLGQDAGRRVLGGRIARGVADRISAVLWFSDLRGFTTITDTAPPGEVIPLLNDYAEAVVSAVQAKGGDVLKLIGDGVLAIFTAAMDGEGGPAHACRCALEAEADMRQRIRALKQHRASEGRPLTTVYVGLHIGEVFYGNIGSESRLDFTVVGPAVNEVSRIAAMCRSVDRPVVISADFTAATPPDLREKLVSVGRFALRGVGRAQELFTLDPGLL